MKTISKSTLIRSFWLFFSAILGIGLTIVCFLFLYIYIYNGTITEYQKILTSDEFKEFLLGSILENKYSSSGSLDGNNQRNTDGLLNLEYSKYLLALLVGIIPTFCLWMFRNQNKMLEIENSRKDTNLKDFQQLQKWATGLDIDQGKKKSSEKTTALQLSAIHQLGAFFRGDFGEQFQIPAYELLHALWVNQFSDIETELSNFSLHTHPQEIDDQVKKYRELLWTRTRSKLANAISAAVFGDGGVTLQKLEKKRKSKYKNSPNLIANRDWRGLFTLEKLKFPHFKIPGINLSGAQLVGVSFNVTRKRTVRNPLISLFILTFSSYIFTLAFYFNIIQYVIKGSNFFASLLPTVSELKPSSLLILFGLVLSLAIIFSSVFLLGIIKFIIGSFKRAMLRYININNKFFQNKLLRFPVIFFLLLLEIIFGYIRGISKILTRVANLSNANLYYSDLRKASLVGVNLKFSDLCGADLSGASLRVANLSGADLFGADLRDTNLWGANIKNAYLLNLSNHSVPSENERLLERYRCINYDRAIIGFYKLGESKEIQIEIRKTNELRNLFGLPNLTSVEEGKLINKIKDYLKKKGIEVK